MVPSFTGGSSTPFLVSPCVWAGGRRPEGAVPRPVQRTVRRGAPAPAGPRLPISPPPTPDRKVPTGSKRGSERCSPPEHRGRGKKSKENPQPMATAHRTRESYFTYGPARAGRRAVHLLPGRLPHESEEHPARAFYSFFSQGTRGPDLVMSGPSSHTPTRALPVEERPSVAPVTLRLSPRPSDTPRARGEALHAPVGDRTGQITDRGSIGRPPASSLIWISVPMVGQTPQS